MRMGRRGVLLGMLIAGLVTIGLGPLAPPAGAAVGDITEFSAGTSSGWSARVITVT
jgi:hypothetical protein